MDFGVDGGMSTNPRHEKEIPPDHGLISLWAQIDSLGEGDEWTVPERQVEEGPPQSGHPAIDPGAVPRRS